MSNFLSFFRRYFINDLAIDLGTANTLIYMRGKGIILDEPSVVAMYQAKAGSVQRVICAVGSKAKCMLGKTPDNISAVRPIKGGIISDVMVTQQMLKKFIYKVQPQFFFFTSPRIVICVPCSSTQAERLAIRELVLGAGASQVFLIEAPIAAAIGAGLPIADATGSMVVDIGAGTTEVAIISLDGIVYFSSIRVGGDKLNEAIIQYIRFSYGVLISEKTAEIIKKSLGGALLTMDCREMEVQGRHLAEGVPRSFTISSIEIYEALAGPIASIVNAVKVALEHTPPELWADLLERGMLLTGGGALLPGMSGLLSESTGFPVIIADDPLTCVVRGTGIALEKLHIDSSVYCREQTVLG